MCKSYISKRFVNLLSLHFLLLLESKSSWRCYYSPSHDTILVTSESHSFFPGASTPFESNFLQELLLLVEIQKAQLSEFVFFRLFRVKKSTHYLILLMGCKNGSDPKSWRVEGGGGEVRTG